MKSKYRPIARKKQTINTRHNDQCMILFVKRASPTLHLYMYTMIAPWNSSPSVLPVARVQFPATAEYFKGFFPGWSPSVNPSWASVAENGSISPPNTPHNLWTSRRKAEVQPWIDDGRKKTMYTYVLDGLNDFLQSNDANDWRKQWCSEASMSVASIRPAQLSLADCWPPSERKISQRTLDKAVVRYLVE